MASRSDVNDINEEFASKMSKQLSAIKSDDENVSDIGDPLESLESFDESIAQKDMVKENEARQASEYDSDTSLVDLNDDCLYSVLRWFSLKDQACVERVNRQWLRAAERCLKGQRAVALSCLRYSNSEESDTIYVPDDKFKYFSQVFSRLTSLRTVHFRDLMLSCLQLCFFLAECKQPIEYIKFSKCEIDIFSNESCEQFGERSPFHSINTAEFYNCQLNGDFLAVVFQKAGYNLKVLTIDDCSISRSDPFKYLPNSVEKLVVGKGKSSKPEEISFLKNSACISALALKEAVFNDVDLDLVENLVSQMASLELLKLTYSYISFPRINSEFLNGFRRLRSLSIEAENRHFVLSDPSSLKSFGELKYFKLGRWRATPTSFAQLISKMPNLVSLSLDLEVICQCPVPESDFSKEELEMNQMCCLGPCFGPCIGPSYGYGCLGDSHRQFTTRETVKQIDPRDDPCQQNFLQPLSALSKLRSLDLDGADEEGLAKLLDKGLLALRKLSIACVWNAAVIQAFVKAAKAEPKKEFVLTWNDLRGSNVAHIDFPRNVRKLSFWEHNRDFCC